MKATRGFTLIEMLIVIAILAMIIALLFPALQSARASARQIQCSSTTGQITSALLTYSIDHRNRSIMSMPLLPTYPAPYFNWHHLLASKGYISASWTGLGQDKAAKAFACAAEDPSSTWNTKFNVPVASSWQYLWNGSHYGMNSYLCVVGPRKGSGSNTTARLDRIPKPASIYVVSDFTGHYHNYIAYYANPDTRNLAVNIERHRGNATMSYLDGRVNTLNRQTLVVGAPPAFPGFPNTSISKRNAAWFGL